MMGSRGEPSPQVTALVTLYELLELAKSADLPGHIVGLREAEKAARTALGELDKKTAELDAHRAEFAELQLKLIDDRTTFGLEVAAHQTKAAEIERQQASFDKQKTAIGVLNQEVSDRANMVAADETALQAAKLLHAGEHQANAKALVEESNRLHRESEAVIEALRMKAESDIQRMRAKAQAEITAAQEALRAREDALVAREVQLHRERARISALLQE